jgi:hydrogenase large subunit
MATTIAPTSQSGTSGKSRKLVDMNWDPITRIVGSLGIFTKIDFENREVAECHSTSSIFRGYSIFMKGKDPRDAHFITSRICGICGDNHATCAMYAQNMAFGVKTPPLGEWIVNLGEAAEYMFDHNIFQDNLVGVDFCEQMVRATNPSVWEKAKKTESPHATAHGYRTIADIMTALNPFTGSFYLETLQVSRYTREMFCLMEGRHVHPSTLYPGGVGTVPTVQLFTDYLVRLARYAEFMKKCVPLHDDLFDFFYEALPGYEKVGYRRTLLGCWGSFQDPDVCDYTYKNMPASISPHDFRRYIATYLLSEGMRLEVVQQFLGHASPETTRKAYAMTWDEVMDDQVATYRPALSEAAERAHGKVKKFESRKKAPRGLRPAP